MPLLWALKSQFNVARFGAVLLAVAGVGHHLPGFIRAYTDPALFRRFRARFIIAPLFLLAVCASFAALHLESLTLVLTLWGIWHGAMQVNGFLRIYDGKVGSFSKITSRLDRAMCVAWFSLGLLYSKRFIVVLSYYFKAGGDAVSPNAFAILREVWLIATAALTVAFAVNAWNERGQGRAPSPVKLLTMASSFAVWFFAMILVDNLLLAILIFELVHDIQYNALVWVYNERRVSQGMATSAAEKFLFRRTAAKALLYAGLVIGYGFIGVALDYVDVQVPNILQIGASTVQFWTSLFIVSTFLHFYFDGFIWQVREKGFRQGLKIGAGGESVIQGASRLTLSNCLRSNWKWAFFVIPVVLLGYFEYRGMKLPMVDQARNAAQLFPESWQAQAAAGVQEEAIGDENNAIAHLQRGIALNPSFSKGQSLLGNIYSRRGNAQLAMQYYLAAVDAYPENYEAQQRLGSLLASEHRYAEAIPHLQIAARNPQSDANADYLLGASLVQENRPLDGVPYLQRAVRLDPKNKEAFACLGIALQSQRQFNEAAVFYRRALDIDPDYAPVKEALAQVQQLMGSSYSR